MNRLLTLSLATIAVLACGCSAAPPSSHEVGHDPILANASGVAMVVDVCVQRNGLGGSGDYFIVDESRFGAAAVQDKLSKYFSESNIIVREQALFVCGAQHGDQPSILTADRVGSDASLREQPLLFVASKNHDSDYAAALRVISRYAFERATAENDTASSPSVSQLQFLDAADLVQYETGAASVFFLGAMGVSRTGALNTVSVIGRTIFAVATAVPIGSGFGNDYYLFFMPGAQSSGRLMAGALIDLSTGDLAWSNAVRVGGNPAKEKHWENDQPIELLIHDLLFQPSGLELLDGASNR